MLISDSIVLCIDITLTTLLSTMQHAKQIIETEDGESGYNEIKC